MAPKHSSSGQVESSKFVWICGIFMHIYDRDSVFCDFCDKVITEEHTEAHNMLPACIDFDNPREFKTKEDLMSHFIKDHYRNLPFDWQTLSLAANSCKQLSKNPEMA